MKTLSRPALAGILLVLLFGVACSKKPYTGEKMAEASDGTQTVKVTESRSQLPDGGLAGTDSEFRQIVAKVESVNQKTRMLSLLTSDGVRSTFKVGPEVRNLPQVKVGDTVRLSFFESVAFEVRKPTATETAESGAVTAIGGRAPKGDKPGTAIAAGVKSVLTIESINTDNQTLTLRGPGGPITVKAKYPENLKFVKTGDTVIVTVTELFAASVDPVS